MAAESKYQGVYPQLVTKIIASYVSHHNLSPEQIPDLISSVHRTIDNLGKPVEPQAALIPAVPARRPVPPDAVTRPHSAPQGQNPPPPSRPPPRLVGSAAGGGHQGGQPVVEQTAGIG